MPNVKPKIIVVTGPTSSGKSDAAIRLAKEFDGEIVSADSRQIFRGMDIGTGKILRDFSVPSKKSKVKSQKQDEVFISEGIPHHLIDVADPMEDFNVSHFKKLAEQAVEEILGKEKLPIICGGTGFWISSVVDDVRLPEVAPNEELRSALRNRSAEDLFSELGKLDPGRAENIDAKNKVRLIRAIEVATKLGRVPDKLSVISHQSSEKYEFLQVGIEIYREELNAKIKKRLEARFAEGMVEEVKKLHENGVSWEWLEKIGLEYRWIARYLQGKMPFDEMKEKLYYDSIRYAKRQMTWLRRDKRIVWLKEYGEMEKKVRKFLEN